MQEVWWSDVVDLNLFIFLNKQDVVPVIDLCVEDWQCSDGFTILKLDLYPEVLLFTWRLFVGAVVTLKSC